MNTERFQAKEVSDIGRSSVHDLVRRGLCFNKYHSLPPWKLSGLT